MPGNGNNVVGGGEGACTYLVAKDSSLTGHYVIIQDVIAANLDACIEICDNDENCIAGMYEDQTGECVTALQSGTDDDIHSKTTFGWTAFKYVEGSCPEFAESA